MSPSPATPEPTSRRRWRRLEHTLDQFDTAWVRGERPEIDAFRHDAAGEDLLADLLHIDLEYRMKAGERDLLSEYLERYPELNADPDLLRSLSEVEADLLQRFQQANTLALSVSGSSSGLPELPGYELIRELGRGGMGVVYLARQRSLGRLVALKTLSSEATPEEFARLKYESEVIARLQHPNIVQVHEVGEHLGRVFIVLEYVPGGNLAGCSGRPLAAEEAVRLVEKLARAVEVVHRAGIIHRDLKPANVLLQRTNHRVTETTEKNEDSSPVPSVALWLDSALPKIADFGLARCIDALGQTQTRQVLGTPAYMAPEQAAGRSRDADARTDVWGLGAIFYELLTGRPPFQADSPIATAHEVLHAELTPPTQLRPGLARDVETICSKCLEKAPSHRYATALELAEDLLRFQRGEPIHARPPGPVERGVKWMRRHPGLAAVLVSAGLGVLALASSLVVFTLYLDRALANRTEELRQDRLTSDRHQEALRRAEHYRQDMTLAARLVQAGESTRARGLLEGQRGNPERGFEWDLLRKTCQQEMGILRHADDVWGVAFAPDGRTLVTVGRGRDISFWDIHARSIRKVVDSGDPVLLAIAFSTDGQQFATGSLGGTVRLWETVTGKMLASRTLPSPIARLAFSPKGALLALGTRAIRFGDPGSVHVWQLPQLEPVANFPRQSHTEGVLGFSPGGDRLALTRVSGCVDLWDPVQRSFSTPMLIQSAGTIKGLAFAHRLPLLAIAHLTGEIEIRHTETHATLARLVHERMEPACLAFSPEDDLVACGAKDRTLRIWDRNTTRLFAVLRDHDQPLTDVRFSPAGNTLASASSDGTVRLWDVARLRMGRPLLPRIHPEGTLATSPDRTLLAIPTIDHRIQLLDATSFSCQQVLVGHTGMIRRVCFSPDGLSLASAGEDRMAFLWDVRSGREIARLVGHTGAIGALAFSPDGRAVVSGSRDRRLLLWRPQESVRALASAEDHRGEISDLGFSPDGKTLASASLDGTVRLRDPGTLKSRSSVTESSAVVSLVYSRDGTTFLTGTTSGKVTRRRSDSTARVGAYEFGGYSLRQVGFLPDGERMALIDVWGVLHFWGASGLMSWIPAFGEWTANPSSFAVLGNEEIATAGRGRLRCWDLARWHVREPGAGPLLPVSGLAFCDSGRTLLTLSSGPSQRVSLRPFGIQTARIEDLVTGVNHDALRRWDVATGHMKESLPHPSPLDLQALAISHKGRFIWAAGEGAVIWRWRASGGEPDPPRFASPEAARRWAFLQKALDAKPLPSSPAIKDRIGALAVSPDGTRLAVAQTAIVPYAMPNEKSVWQITLWKVEDWTLLTELPSMKGAIPRLCFSSDGLLVAASADERLMVWDIQTGASRLDRTTHPGGIRALAFGSDPAILATGGSDFRIRQWNVWSGKELRTFAGHTDIVSGLTYSPDGQRLVSSSHDGTLRVWDTTRGWEILALEGNSGPLSGLAFSPDGKTLATAGYLDDCGRVILWRQ